MIRFVDLACQVKELESELRTALDRVLASGWFVLGAEVKAFEEDFARFLGVDACVGVGSGTEAIEVALRALGVGPGDEVITVANTCVPTVAGIAATGATPVLVDAEPDHLTLDASKLEVAITDKTKAMVPVHLYGHSCDMDAICAVAGDREVAIVEDCAQAHGARYRGKLCGTFGALAAFSFYPTKNLGALGDAGAVVSSDPELAERARMIRNYGERERYHHAIEGVNSRLDEMQAAVLRVKLPHLLHWNEIRAAIAKRYHDGLRETSVSLVAEADWAESCHHLTVLRTPSRDALQKHLADRGIGTLMHYPVPIHLQEAYRHLGYQRDDFPVAEQACDEVLSVPNYPGLSSESVDTVIGAIAEFGS